jgi:hypothetical protein
MKLNPLSESEILTLLERLADIHALNYNYQIALTVDDLKEFIKEIVNRLGAQAMLTPGEIVRDFISVLNILHQNPQITLGKIINDSEFKPTTLSANTDVDEDGVASFSL